jgi:hypothetical protein
VAFLIGKSGRRLTTAAEAPVNQLNLGGRDMRLTKLLGLILIGVLVTTPAFAKDDSYLCVAESAVGFSFNKASQQWERANFKADKKYLVSKSSEGGKTWEVKEMGQSEGTTCEEGFNENGFIKCKGLLDFTMNKNSLRYILVHPYGYVVKEYKKGGFLEEGALTPYLEIGKCSPL